MPRLIPGTSTCSCGAEDGYGPRRWLHLVKRSVRPDESKAMPSGAYSDRQHDSAVFASGEVVKERPAKAERFAIT
jgi:hypothetical protein